MRRRLVKKQPVRIGWMGMGISLLVCLIFASFFVLCPLPPKK
jgi:hypothetical protein